ncbi:mannitol/fructose-specific phosphotransferase system, IIA domain protein [Halobacteroides halobius DSM 5150]|uniref:Mannitol-specific phosphotransferase enzyme IIA component n=1 Tax=Halobacteroides halobius (strain ATCC 35273 / DSM 5150 / MD-1) TaxID=748449 RepID=L0K6Z1_HALHC|nr:PTS sugar transporter subunit IIA [Halobacteroides halobius]AGB40290.1 mannitol/fructose-specific phosphotransferase system, IIA domain protein [Halobacteroides halobius DSM 5150]
MGILNFFKEKKKEKKEKLDKVLTKDTIVLGAEAENKTEAIEMGGQLLVDGGYVPSEYIEEMKEREEKVSTYMGNGVAIPHGTADAKKYINKSGVSVIQFPDGVDFGDGNMAYLVISIAGEGDQHLKILQNLATICQDEDETKKMIKADSKEIICEKLLAEEV